MSGQRSDQELGRRADGAAQRGLERDNHELRAVVARQPSVSGDDDALRALDLERRLARLSGLYAAAARLADAVDRREVLTVIREVVKDFIGSEAFGVYEVAPATESLTLLSSMGPEAEEQPRVALGSGAIGSVVVSGKVRLGAEGESPCVCVPLHYRGRVTAVVAIFALLPQKPALVADDLEIFDLLSRHGGRALACSMPGRDPGGQDG